MCFAPQRRALFRHLKCQKWSAPGVLCKFWLGNVLRATTASNFSTSQVPKVVRTWCVLYILTWKCASHHNGVHFLDISSAKSGPHLVCFVNFDLEMCFAPQRRALFRHLKCQKWSAPGVFCKFWLGNVLRNNGLHFFDISSAKSGPHLVCFVHFDLEMRFVPQPRVFFNISTSKSARSTRCFVRFDLQMCFAPQWRAIFDLSSGHGSAPAALASLLFDPPEPQIIRKTQCFATFLPFHASASSFFLLFFLLIFSLLIFLFSLLCPALLFICPYCRKFAF